MLTDTDKERIRLEESYRHELRSESAENLQGSKRWQVLNSNFMIFLLSAVFVSGAGTVYSKWQQSSAEQAQTREKVGRLDLEIGYRFAQIQALLCSWATENKTDEQQAIRIRLDLIRMVQQPPPQEGYITLYPEFEKFGLPGLVGELIRLEPVDKRRSELDHILAHLTAMPAFFAERSASVSRPQEVAGAIIGGLVVDRWKERTNWYYLDAKPETPCLSERVEDRKP